ncbi:CAP domain-containing protein [Paenirhodobacter sp.]|jgi:uncharacterized protein YkwD|uniref:CAP domain-containing protein n=1 Tax=Paenirhodobacter sp. TaxID=1965326 RepID=UPI003B50B299
MIGTPIRLGIVAAVLAACGAAHPPPVATQSTSAPAPRLPGRVVWTDGHGDIAVAAAGQAHCPAVSPSEAQVALAQTNATRAQQGLPPLVTDPTLQRVAEQHACDMANRGAMTHLGTKTTGPMARAKQEGYRPRIIAENIAAGRFGLDRTLAEWSASPGHRANIMIGQMREFGIGYAVAADGKTMFWTAVYANPR